MDNVYMLLIIAITFFIFIWVGFCVFARKKMNWSWIISLGGGFVLSIFIICIFISIIIPYQPPPNIPAVEVRPSREDLIKNQFSPWDGSHRKLEYMIKQTMNDPSSYEHVRTTYLEQGDFLIIKTTFRGKNAFNAMVINSVTARVDLNGNILELLSQDD